MLKQHYENWAQSLACGFFWFFLVLFLLNIVFPHGGFSSNIYKRTFLNHLILSLALAQFDVLWQKNHSHFGKSKVFISLNCFYPCEVFLFLCKKKLQVCPNSPASFQFTDDIRLHLSRIKLAKTKLQNTSERQTQHHRLNKTQLTIIS